MIARIGRGGTTVWPPRSPDLTTLDFSAWGYVKDKGFVPHLPANLEVQRTWITEAVATTDADMNHRTLEEISYSWHICRVTCGNRNEHL